MEDMGNPNKDFNWKMEDVRARVLVAMLPEVAFDGWSEEAYQTALRRSGVDAMHAELAFPRHAIDVARYMHFEGDREMLAVWPERIDGLPGYSEKIEEAINLRLEIASMNKEAVARAASLFALPQNSVISAKLIWNTADAIWNALGDDSKGFTHYSKRSSLSMVYSTSFLYWLQDTSGDGASTREFVGRRIRDVGNFGKFTSKFKKKPA